MYQNLINGTKLNDRFLSYDGDSILEPDKILDLILNGCDIKNIYTTNINKDIDQFNTGKINKITEKIKSRPFDLSLNIPEKYINIDPLQYVINKYVETTQNTCKGRYDRLIYEMSEFKKYELYDFLRTLIYIQEIFDKENIVKGVGRGSSVASYTLYIIGIHIIDSYKYNLDFKEFIREEDFINDKNN